MSKTRPASEHEKGQARSLFDRAKAANDVVAQDRRNPDSKRAAADAWAALWQFKRTCKQSWEELGFGKKEVDSIKFYKPDWI